MTETTSTPTTATTTPPANMESAPAQKAATPETQARMLKLKIDNADVEMSEAEVIALAQKGKSADQRFQEAAKTRKEMEEFQTLLKKNPAEALRKYGLDPHKFSEEFLGDWIKEQSMTPEQKQASEREKKLSAYETAEAEAKAKAKTEREQAEEATHAKEYNDKFIAALSESGLPKTAYTVKRMAELEMVNIKKGMGLTASQLAKLVREDFAQEQKAIYGSVDGEALIQMLGPELVKKLSRAQVEKLKASAPKFSKPVEKPAQSRVENTANAWKQFQKKNRGRI